MTVLRGRVVGVASAVLVVSALVSWSSPVGADDQPGSITEFPVQVPSAPSDPQLFGITEGPDGALWFVASFGDAVGRMTPDGVVTGYVTTGTAPQGITTGPDGNLWVTEQDPVCIGGAPGTSGIGRITPAGVHAPFALPAPTRCPIEIVTGPDGFLWFTNQRLGTGSIGRLDPANPGTSFVDFVLPTAGGQPFGLTVGPDGLLWFTDSTQSAIGHLDPTAPDPGATIVEIPLGAGHTTPLDITVGPDGALWFALENSNEIGRVTTAGALSFLDIPTADSQPVGIVTGPDGALWFTGSNTDTIGRVTTVGAFTERTLTAGAGPQLMARGPGATLWFTEASATAPAVGRISGIVAPALTAVIDFAG